MESNKSLDPQTKQLLYAGTVIPAHPLALTQNLTIDEKKQRALTRYYIESGAGGVAVGVHTTQFGIREPGIDLLESTLRLAAEEIDKNSLSRPFIKVAGICGPVKQAVKESVLALKYGYHLGLLSMGGLDTLSEKQLIERAREIAEIIPLFGFYLQPAVGGRILSYSFWEQFAEIQNVLAIKVAAFNRYQTLDVVRAVCHSSRSGEIALYTGNDDNIVADLLTPYRFAVDGKLIEKTFVGGLLGHWAFWTKKTVDIFAEIKYCLANNYAGADKLLAKGIEITDVNAAVFDAANKFSGCIPGIHEILRRQGLLHEGVCINRNEKLSPGQLEEIDRIYASYSGLNDDAFVENFIRTDR
jgi:hypothetical protein